MEKPEVEAYAEFGRSMVIQADAQIRARIGLGSISAALKTDRSPVTEIDIAVEEFVRAAVTQRFPDHGVVGEERGVSNPAARSQWIVDPIDGTENLIRGIPTYGMILGLQHAGEAVLGFLHHPALDISVEGARGIGVRRNGTPLSALDSGPSNLEDAVIAISTRASFNRANDAEKFDALVKMCPKARIYYDCFAHTLAAVGALDAVVEFNMKIWDFIAAEALLPEVGGSFAYVGNDEGRSDPAKRLTAVFGKKETVRELLAVLGG